MLRRLRHTRATYGIAALYALALVVLGLAHRPIVAPFAPQADLAAYALPDGSFPPICGQNDEHRPEQTASSRCDACALSAAPGLAPPGGAPALVRAACLIAQVGPEASQYAATTRHAPVSRGPPAA